MPLSFKDGPKITLQQILLAKEKRVQHQYLALLAYQSTLISLTLVIPGEIKKSSAADYLFQEAILAIETSLQKYNIVILYQQEYQLISGNEAIIVVDCCADKLKQLCIDIELTHPLGRLWDIDVIEHITQTSIPRSKFTYPSRLCLICDDEAKICSRSRRHKVEDLLDAMLMLLNKILPRTPF